MRLLNWFGVIMVLNKLNYSSDIKFHRRIVVAGVLATARLADRSVMLYYSHKAFLDKWTRYRIQKYFFDLPTKKSFLVSVNKVEVQSHSQGLIT